MKRKPFLLSLAAAALTLCIAAYGFALVGAKYSNGNYTFFDTATQAVLTTVQSGTQGFQANRMARESMTAGTVTVTAAQSGEILTAGTVGNFNVNLPAGTAGMNYAFANIAAATTYVNPNGTEQILYSTDSAGDRIRTEAAKAGCTFRLICVSDGTWVVMGSLGTITDAN